jgi:hypothetical protein
MNRQSHRPSRISAAPLRSRLGWKLRGRELDLLLLAGCSCLITTLSHPVVEALQARSVNSAPAAATTQTQPAQSSSSLAISAALPTRREDIQEEEA